MGKAKYDEDALLTIELNAAAATARAWKEADNDTRMAGLGWYPVAREWAKIVGETAGFEGNQAVLRGAIAIGVLSPRVRWAQNVNDAVAIAEDDFDYTPAAFGPNVVKAMVALARDVTDEEALEQVGGRKVTAFIDNIYRPKESQEVVIDTHMCKLFDIPGRDIELAGVYEACARGVQVAADAIGIPPPHAQAIAWLQTRGPDKEDVIG